MTKEEFMYINYSKFYFKNNYGSSLHGLLLKMSIQNTRSIVLVSSVDKHTTKTDSVG